ncbi:hypothetical protein KNE206_61610 [Kitasatospora sp. NE20-6]
MATGVHDVNELVGVVFSRLSALVVKGVTDEGEAVRVPARPPLPIHSGHQARRVLTQLPAMATLGEVGSVAVA